jgi:hypothetical protein
MAQLTVQGRLSDDTVNPDYQVSPQSMIDKFIGAETGAALEAAYFTLETDDGHTVQIIVSPAYQRQGGGMHEATMAAHISGRPAPDEEI